jgi:hypothetical protein
LVKLDDALSFINTARAIVTGSDTMSIPATTRVRKRPRAARNLVCMFICVPLVPR